MKKPKPVHHASDFGLDVLSGDDDMFRWFLLTYLLGKPIQSKTAEIFMRETNEYFARRND